ncbi:MAG: aminodeoxychorismate synthase component I [Acidobacteria bacterium]|nr:aminodeoxychorismate synthase component I [Acidobacteriota bacterium]
MSAWTKLPEYLRALAASSRDVVLLETSRFDADNAHSYLFLDPVETIVANALDEIPAMFERIECALADGMHVAGYIGYECGEHFVMRCGRVAAARGEDSLPLAWFGVYRKPFVFDHAAGAFAGDAPAEVTVEQASASALGDAAPRDLRLDIAEAEYTRTIERIKRYIEAGDTYQVNFTDAVTVRLPHSPATTFAALAAAQPVAYSALLHVGERHILSHSPELFFRVAAGGRIVARPMKGTMPRGLDSDGDARQAARLAADEKNRAEHIMIVDLLRNDLGRICRMGSVQVEELFAVERYRTLLQMTSTISGRMRVGPGWHEIFGALFPSGSITGAPKIRTMEIIRELERGPRGVYTGAIGHIAPTGEAAFSVAIRTLVVEDGVARMGVGGGIVADSAPEAEYRECQLKASFLQSRSVAFELIETMLFDGGGIVRLTLHLDRLAASAAYFDFVFERQEVEARLAAMVKDLLRGVRSRVRLLLGAPGGLTLSHSPLEEGPAEIVVRLSSSRVNSGDVFVRHKTTRREMYDRELARAREAGFDEVLFVNERGELTEGAISTLFVRSGGRLLTPPLACGVLPGVLRRHILATDPTAEERVLLPKDLDGADAVFLGNSVRGLRRVVRVEKTGPCLLSATRYVGSA